MADLAAAPAAASSTTRRRCARADPAGMLGLVAELPDQVAEAWRALARRWTLPWAAPRAVAVLGMGGSAIGGDLVAGIWSDRLTVPLEVVRGYDLPAWVGPDDARRRQLQERRHRGDHQRPRGRPRAPLPGRGLTTGGPLRDVARACRPAARDVPGRRAAARGRGLLDGAPGRAPGACRRPGRSTRPRSQAGVAAARAMAARCAPGVPTAANPAKQLAWSLVDRLRDHRRRRLPGAGGAALEDAAQRERQGHGRLRGAAGGDPQHGRRLRAAGVPARPPLRRLPEQPSSTIRATRLRAQLIGELLAYGRRSSHAGGAGRTAQAGWARRSGGPHAGRPRERLRGLHLRRGPDARGRHRPHQGAARPTCRPMATARST